MLSLADYAIVGHAPKLVYSGEAYGDTRYNTIKQRVPKIL